MTIAEMLAIADREAATGADGKKRISQTGHSRPIADPGELHCGRSGYEPIAIQRNERDEVHYLPAGAPDHYSQRVTLASEWRIAFPDKCKQCGGIARGDECGMSPPCRAMGDAEEALRRAIDRIESRRR